MSTAKVVDMTEYLCRRVPPEFADALRAVEAEMYRHVDVVEAATDAIEVSKVKLDEAVKRLRACVVGLAGDQ